MYEIRHMIEIAAPPGVVYALVSSGEGFSRWWAADVGAGPDGTVELGFFRRATVYRLRSEELKPAAYATWLVETGKEWSGTRIRFELEPRAEKTVLRFTHSDWPDETDYFTSCNTTWGILMSRLKAVAEGGRAGPLFSADGMAY